MTIKLYAIIFLNVFLLIDDTIGQTTCPKIKPKCKTIHTKKYGILTVKNETACDLKKSKECANELLFEDKEKNIYCISARGKGKEKLSCHRKGNQISK